MHNPYVAGNPVGGSLAFVGRADVLREVLRVLRRPQDNAIVLYGQRRIGKTSILQHLKVQLPNEGSYHPVFFDLQDKAAWPLSQALQNLAGTIAHTLGHPEPNLDPNVETAFRDEWLPAVLGDLPEGSSLVLLFDEFDVLADPNAEQAASAFFPYLRSLLVTDPQRLQFVFAIGRNIDDLTNIALSLLRGTPAQRVSLLSREDTTDVVRLSEANNTLHWPDDVASRVYELTCGHPFLIQQLCSHVWEHVYDEEPDEPPTVILSDVDHAVPDALDASRNALEWLWDGLPPAERVVASALAKAGPGSITQGELEHLLRESGIRVIIRELQRAPQLLQNWDLIEPTDSGYRFRVELLRHWIAENKPLRLVQEEMDNIEPAAEGLYQAASGLYQSGKLDQAVGYLREAINLNPNHVKANQLLADILIAQDQPEEARILLESLYDYHPAAARPRLVQALLMQAQTAESEDKQLENYQQILELAPEEQVASAEVARIEQERQRRIRLADMYDRALGALQNNDQQTAKDLLIQIVSSEPEYKKATHYLHQAVTGVDIAELEAQLREARERLWKRTGLERSLVDSISFSLMQRSWFWILLGACIVLVPFSFLLLRNGREFLCLFAPSSPFGPTLYMLFLILLFLFTFTSISRRIFESGSNRVIMMMLGVASVLALFTVFGIMMGLWGGYC